MTDDVENKNFSWSQLFRSYSQFYNRIKPVFILLWIVLFFVILLPLLGEIIITNSFSKTSKTPNQLEHSKSISDKQNYQELTFVNFASKQSKITKEMQVALKSAHDKSEFLAEARIDAWIDSLMYRVDHDFLNWYFGYFNKKWREDSALITAPIIWITGGDVGKHYGKTFEREFSKRVISKDDAKDKMKEITERTVKCYLRELNHKINRVAIDNEIPQTEWDKYLSTISLNIPGGGNDISLNGLGELGYAGSYLIIAKPLIVSALKFGVIEKVAAIAGIKFSAKLGLNVAATTVAPILDPIALLGLAIWDVWDHKVKVKEQKPAMRESIFESFQEIKYSLLHDSKTGVMTGIEQLENDIRKSIKSTPISEGIATTSVI
ncbi:MAG: hypothetical protein F6K36_29365 [Symploca sp. SIO3C6]|nr:hypothetical protein [Symploca sp. SIO3C6]